MGGLDRTAEYIFVGVAVAFKDDIGVLRVRGGTMDPKFAERRPQVLVDAIKPTIHKGRLHLVWIACCAYDGVGYKAIRDHATRRARLRAKTYSLATSSSASNAW